jgi:hypothetical protein
LDLKKAEKLFLMQLLGNRKPSQMMAAMLEVCLKGEEKNKYFCLPVSSEASMGD